jgi:hypothetical protein
MADGVPERKDPPPLLPSRGDAPPGRRRGRRWARLILFQALATLLLCEVALRLLTTTDPENGMAMIGRHVLLPLRPDPTPIRAWLGRPPDRYLAPDPELGWTVRPLGESPDGLYHATAEGARAAPGRTYGERPPPGRLRVVTVGDSFTHGDGVAVGDTWQTRLEQRRADLEVINLGVGGYGTDQAYLRWLRDGARLSPHVAVLGIWPEAICRNLNVVRFFLQPVGGFGLLSKPRLVWHERLENVNEPVLQGEALVHALTDPASEMRLRHDYWAIPHDLEPRPWHRLRVARVMATVASLYRRRALRDRLYTGDDPSGIELTAAIADAFRADAEGRGVTPVILLLPMADLVERYAEEDAFPLARALRRGGLDVIDLGPPMARAQRNDGASCCYLADGHLSKEGNRRVAEWLLERLAPRLDQPRAALKPAPTGREPGTTTSGRTGTRSATSTALDGRS